MVNLSAPDIVPAMKSGALDAAEWIGPRQDFSFGLHRVGKYYYYPGFHEPATVLCLGINGKFWKSLNSEEQKLIETAATAFCTWQRAYNDGQNANLLPRLVKEYGVQLRKFDDSILKAFGKMSSEVVTEIGTSDPFTRRVYDGYMKFRENSHMWIDISERAYLNARALNFPDRS